jgi:hypothetical protein
MRRLKDWMHEEIEVPRIVVVTYWLFIATGAVGALALLLS